MKFELDDTLIDEIIFAMEDQEGEYYLDTKEVMVINQYVENFDEEDDDDDRYIDIPDWSASDGYRIMEKFTSSLKNPLLRRQLSDALNRSKGVFRAFKDVLARHPQAEKQWYDFKDKKMKGEVINWYNGLREEWGLEPIGEEPEDTTSLVLEDFLIQKKDCNDLSVCFCAKAHDGKNSGCIKAVKTENGIHIKKLEVEPEYRGMGLGKTLLSKLLEEAGDQTITVDVPAESDFFSRSLLLEGFELISKKLKRK